VSEKASGLAWLVAAVSLTLAGLMFVGTRGTGANTAPAATTPGLIESIDKTGTIRAGYGVFPPFSQEDPHTGQVTGVSIDIINEIARQLRVKVEWKRFNWNTMAADLKRGEYDILADVIFQTPERGREFAFTEPFAYFAIGIGVVKSSDTRFSRFDQIDDPAITVAVGQGFAEETFVKARAPHCKLLSIPSSQDTAAPINAVVTGRADIAIVNAEDAKRFLAANPTHLKVLWTDPPPAYVPAGFALRLDDLKGAGFIDVALRNLRSTGVLTTIGVRYGTQKNLVPPPQS
jgi:ABC-type amino acid transport substrate-binding protein